MFNTDRLINDLVLRLQLARDEGDEEIERTLVAILGRHGTVDLSPNGNYTFRVAVAAVYTGYSVVSEQRGLPSPGA